MPHFEYQLRTDHLPQDHWKEAGPVFARCWEPEAEPRAVVCLVHGLGEHSGRYAHLGRYLNRAGYSLLALDLYGHGKSGGQRGHLPELKTYLQQIDLLLEEAQRKWPGKPRFLYGHSMGGLLVLNYTLQEKPALAGVIVTSTGLRTALEEQKAKVVLVRLLGSVWPTLVIPSGLDPTGLSRDPEVIHAYRTDPLVHDRCSAGWGRIMLSVQEWDREHAAEFPPIPLLLMHGTRDELAYPEGSRKFASQVPGGCTLKLWEGLYHETHNEPEQEQVFQFLVEWLDEQLRST